jgi:hypothetical protein
MDVKSRFILCIALVLLSFLLLGAGRVSGELKENNLNKLLERKSWSELTSGMKKEIPREFRGEWAQASEVNPEILFQACMSDVQVLED